MPGFDTKSFGMVDADNFYFDDSDIRLEVSDGDRAVVVRLTVREAKRLRKLLKAQIKWATDD